MGEPNHYPWLDWLRFAAALMVLVGHARGTFLIEFGGLPSEQKEPLVAIAYALTRLGHEAVVVFFVLSGYLVAGRTARRVATNDFRLADYSLDRCTRVFLPYLPALLFTWACAASVGDSPEVKSFLYNLLCLQGVFGESFGGNAPLWSIAYEFWFYVLAGSLGEFWRSRGNNRVRTTLALLTTGTCFVLFTILSSTYLFCWILGGMASCLPQLRRSLVVAAVAAVVGAVIAIQAQFGSLSIDTTHWATKLPRMPVLELIMAGSVGVILNQLIRLTPRSTLAKRLDQLGSRMASFSYTLYLVHYPVLAVTAFYWLPRSDRISMKSVGSLLVGCTISVCVALVFFYLFERNTSRLRHWVRDRGKLTKGGRRSADHLK